MENISIMACLFFKASSEGRLVNIAHSQCQLYLAFHINPPNLVIILAEILPFSE